MAGIIVLGAQYGDEGKGLIGAYVSAKYNAKMVARAGTGSNAEHGLFLRDEETYIKTNQLPLSWMFNPNVDIRVGSGVAVDPTKLFKEMDKYNLHDRVKIDYRCPIIEPKHIEYENLSKGMSKIGSTMSGTGYCRSEFILRKAKQARDFSKLEPYLIDLGQEINDVVKKNNVVIETSQGVLLSLALSPDYPNVTSDNLTPTASADDVLLGWRNINEVILVVKAVPSREGAGSFGNMPELKLEDIQRCGLVEYSSIGGVVRRKAMGIDYDLLKYVSNICQPTQIALTFLDHFDPYMKNVKNSMEITRLAWELIEDVQTATNTPVTILNTGKSFDNIIDLDAPNGLSLLNWNSIEERLKNYTP